MNEACSFEDKWHVRLSCSCFDLCGACVGPEPWHCSKPVLQNDRVIWGHCGKNYNEVLSESIFMSQNDSNTYQGNGLKKRARE